MDLLIAENDFAGVGVLKPRIKAEGYALDLALNTEPSASMQRGREYHAAIVDLDLPSTEGLAPDNDDEWLPAEVSRVTDYC